MRESDIQRIERELGIVLPDVYKRAVRKFPVRALEGNSDTELWDDPAEIISLNKELRNGAPGGVPPWPKHMFALGHGGDGSPAAIDLRIPSAPVWWADHSGLDNPGSGQTHESFEEWLREYIEDMRNDLDIDGYDPEGSAQERAALKEQNEKSGSSCFVIVIVVLLLLGIVLFVASR